MTEPSWLPAGIVIEVNQAEVAATGEPHFLRDAGLLESACARPRHHWSYGEHDIVRLATHLLVGIARNHAFEQGNKRTATTSAIMFMEVNGYRWVMPDNEVLGLAVEAVIVGRLSEDRFAELMRPFVMPEEEDD